MKSCVDTFSSLILTSEFVLPLLKTPPIPQKTKGITTINNNIFAYIVFEKLRILLSIIF